jgi:hypothetical protein
MLRKVRLAIWLSVIASAGIASAQWGTNAQPCQDGKCAPKRETWGYYKTQWQRWPNAVYPDMIGPPAKRGGDQIPPSSIELPSPANEADVQTPSATRGPTHVAPPTGGQPDSAPNMETTPTPPQSTFTPSNPTEMRRPASTMPIEEPQFGIPTPSEPTPAAPRSSALPKSRVRPGLQSAPVAVSPALSELRGQRVSWAETPNANLPSAVVHPATGSQRASASPDDEPDLIIPSLNSRPIDPAASEAKISEPKNFEPKFTEPKISEPKFSEPKISASKPIDVRVGSLPRGNNNSNNPLRGDAGSETLPAAARFSVNDSGTDAGEVSNASRGNPLRRQ